MRDRNFAPHPRLVFGLLLILVGGLFLFDELDVMDVGDIFEFWPLILIIVGVTIAAQPGGTSNRGFGIFLIVAGSWLQLEELDLIDVSFWDAWPILLILVGGWLIWRSTGGGGDVVMGPSGAAGGAGTERAASARKSSDPSVSAFAFLSGFEQVSNTKEFQGGDLTAIMGGCELDLRDASMTEEPAVIDVFAFWGGIEIRVPEDWVVINKVMPLLGGVSDETRPIDEATAKRLLVRGSAIMGGVGIKN